MSPFALFCDSALQLQNLQFKGIKESIFKYFKMVAVYRLYTQPGKEAQGDWTLINFVLSLEMSLDTVALLSFTFNLKL